jgi:hypothetical protein
MGGSGAVGADAILGAIFPGLVATGVDHAKLESPSQLSQ